MKKGLKNAVTLVLAICMLFACAAGMAEDTHPEAGNDAFDMEVLIGYDGMMTYGKVMPVRVRIRNFGDDFEGVLGMNAYVNKKEYDRYEKEVFLPAGSEREFELDMAVYVRQNTFTAELMKDGKVICSAGAEPKTLINPSSVLIGVLSTRPKNLNNLNIDRDNDVLARYELWQTIQLTPDNFPEEAAGLASFSILVIDDIDPAALPQKQQDLLDSWLRSGHILICGGGANAGRNIAYFSKYTGLKLEEVTSSEEVVEGLEKLLGRSVSGRQATAALAVCSGAEPLGQDAEGRGLVWRTAAGGGRIYTAAFETGDARLNSESVMHYFWQQLLVDQDQELYSTMIYSGSDSYSSATVNAGYYAPVEAHSRLLSGLIIVAGVLVLSCAVWWILKKKDKRQWMWLVLPAVSVLAAAGILLLSAGAETNRPMAVIAENVVQDASGTIRNYSGISVAVPEYGRHSYSLNGEPLHVQFYDYLDYDEEEDGKKNQEPDTLRICYTVGGENSVTAESMTPWEMINMYAESDAPMQGRVDGTVWMEEDGLHGEIVNGTDTRFEAGHLITSYGYVSVPELAPGEKASVLLARKIFTDPLNPVYEDGGMYADHPSLYSAINAAVGYNDSFTALSGRDSRDRELSSSMINGAADVLRRGKGNWSYGSGESSLFLYCAKPENMAESLLKADGVPVAQKTYMTILTAELPFSAIGRTGVVFRSAGMDIPVRVETDENLLPGDAQAQNGRQSSYHNLTETPTFRYTLDGMEGVKVETLQVLVDSYYANQCRVFALNAEKREWEQIALNADVKDPGRFLDGEGRLYLQFRSDSQDMYADIPTPMINLEGRLEHAED